MKILENLFHPGKIFKPGREIKIYLCVMLGFGLAAGCFGGVLNNYLVERVGIGAMGRGVLEFFREMPGLLLVVILALFARRSEWWLLRFAFATAVLGVLGLALMPAQFNTAFNVAGLVVVPLHLAVATGFIMLWSLGEHILMPVRTSVSLHLAKPGQEGGAQGLVGGFESLGVVAGSLTVAGVFFLFKFFEIPSRVGFTVMFALAAALLTAGIFLLRFIKDGGQQVKRPRLYFDAKYKKFYILEIFYGARKQVFITFAPIMLITVYNMPTQKIALLAGICAALNIVCSPVAGWIIDRLGYRTVMIWDTILLFFVCLLYGYARDLFPFAIAYWVVCANFILDVIITNASKAANNYVNSIPGTREERTATFSTGISVNHFISILIAVGGAWVAKNHGYGTLFSISAFMALCSTAFTLTIPKPVKK